MALSLFQWIGVGLLVAIVLIPTARWFWKRFDLPSKRALEIMKRHKEDAEEAEIWAGIEAQVEAETTIQRELEMKQREKQERSGKSLNEDKSTDAWTKLGIDVPIKPVEREEAPPVILEKAREESNVGTDLDENLEGAKEPDWELVEKMSKLAEPVAGVPDAPDLDELSDEESGSKEEESDWPFNW